MKLLRRVSFVQLVCLLAAMSVAAPARADPGSVDEALARLLGAVIWNAVGLPSLPGEVESSQSIPAQGGEHAVMLLTLSRTDDPGSLVTLVWDGTRWTLSEAAALPMSPRSDVHWGNPLWFGGRRVLVIEGARFSGTPADSGSWREFFVVDANGSLRRAGTLQSRQPEAELRSNGACARLGESATRCWDPTTQTLR